MWMMVLPLDIPVSDGTLRRMSVLAVAPAPRSKLFSGGPPEEARRCYPTGCHNSLLSWMPHLSYNRSPQPKVRYRAGLLAVICTRSSIG